MGNRQWRPIAAIAGAVGLTLPWVALWVTTGAGAFTGGTGPLQTFGQVLVTGVAMVGAAFLLAWGADAAEKDVPTPVALAVLAVIAVAPEYAVDAYYAWQAGAHAGHGRYASLAIANMTGANRLLIGAGWSAIALFAVVQSWRGELDDDSVVHRDGFFADAVELDETLATKYVFLFVATVYGFLIPFGGISLLDSVVLVGLYVGYVIVIIYRGEETAEADAGVAAYLTSLSDRRRHLFEVGAFVYAGVLIVTAVEPFATGLEHAATQLGLPAFLVVQWVAPLASESPELLVTGYLVTRARSTAGLTALVSSKLNQWTLLVGTLVLVYSISLGYYAQFPLTQQQVGEIWLTAAYSFFALALLTDLRLSVREAVALLVLLVVQLVPWLHGYSRLVGFSIGLIVAGSIVLLYRRASLADIFGYATGRADRTPEPRD